MSDIKLTLDGDDEKDELKENLSGLEKIDEKNQQAPQVHFSEEEEKQIDDFSKKIDLSNSKIVLQYGTGAQKKISNFSEKTLDQVKNKDLGEVGDLLDKLVVEIKSVDTKEPEGPFKFFKKEARKIEALKSRYQTSEKNIEDISKVLESHQITLLKDISMLDQMYDLNENYFKELSMYIEAGKRKLQHTYDVDLPELEKQAKESNQPMDAQKVRDLQEMANRFEKKIHDLELTRAVSLQMAPQIRMVQASNTIMAEKIQTTIVNTIPLRKNQMVLALGMEHTNQAIKAQKEVADLTNELLRKNADQLKQNTIETAKASERGIIDLDTIKHTNQQLIDSITEVRKIQIEGAKNRKAASVEISNLEEELKRSLSGQTRNDQDFNN